MNGAICLKELSDVQIKDYLNSIKKSHLYSLITKNKAFIDLIRAPLFLNMIAIAEKKYQIFRK